MFCRRLSFIHQAFLYYCKEHSAAEKGRPPPHSSSPGYFIFWRKFLFIIRSLESFNFGHKIWNLLFEDISPVNGFLFGRDGHTGRLSQYPARARSGCGGVRGLDFRNGVPQATGEWVWPPEFVSVGRGKGSESVGSSNSSNVSLAIVKLLCIVL
jgi:hypothetical protein